MKKPIMVTEYMNTKPTYRERFDTIEEMVKKLSERASITSEIYEEGCIFDYVVSFDSKLPAIWGNKEYGDYEMKRIQ